MNNTGNTVRKRHAGYNRAFCKENRMTVFCIGLIFGGKQFLLRTALLYFTRSYRKHGVEVRIDIKHRLTVHPLQLGCLAQIPFRRRQNLSVKRRGRYRKHTQNCKEQNAKCGQFQEGRYRISSEKRFSGRKPVFRELFREHETHLQIFLNSEKNRRSKFKYHGNAAKIFTLRYENQSKRPILSSTQIIIIELQNWRFEKYE